MLLKGSNLKMILEFCILYFCVMSSCYSREVVVSNVNNEDGATDQKLSALEMELRAMALEFSALSQSMTLEFNALSLRYHQLEQRVQTYEDKIPDTRVSDCVSDWSECDVTCGGGTQTRYPLTSDDTDQNCTGTKRESRPCNTHNCPTVSQAGVTYVRWGRTTCAGNGTEMVYTGYASGTHHTQTGGGVDYLCLPQNPVPGSSLTIPTTTSRSSIYGAEYQVNGISEELFGDQIADHDVPCSVCLSTIRSAVLVIPGRFLCYDGWHLEYHGYLMSGHYTHASPKTFVCMDVDAEKITGGFVNDDDALFYPIVTRCERLPCPPYKDDQVIACSVCTK